jgi:formyltetrahydrofolate deformylase
VSSTVPAGPTTPTTPSAGTPWVLTLSCPDRPGIVHAVAGLLADHGGNITESQQFGDPLTGLFFMRVQVTSTASRADLERALAELAARFSMTWTLDIAGRPIRTLILGSTAAHCLNDLAFRQRSENLPIEIVAAVTGM